MAGNITKSVAVRLTLSGTQEVKAGLEDVKAEIDDVKAKSPTIRINADAKNWQDDYAKALAEAKELGATEVKIKITGDTSGLKKDMAEASAMLAESGLAGKISGSASTGNDVEKMSLLKTLIGKGGLGNSWGALFGGGSAAASEGGDSGIMSMLASPVGIGALGVGAFAASPVIGSLLGGGIGFAGAAGAYALGSSANTQMQALTTQMDSLNKAMAKRNANGTLSMTPGSAAWNADIAQYNKDFLAQQKLQAKDGGVISVYNGVQGIKTAGESVLTGAIENGGANSFASGIGKILSSVGPFIKTLGPDLTKMFQASLPFVKMFVTALEDFASHAIPALTSVMEHLKPYMPMMQRFFDSIGIAIGGVIRAIGWMSGVFLTTLRLIGDLVTAWATRVGQNINSISNFIGRMVHDVAALWDEFGHDMANWAQNVENWITRAVDWFLLLPSRIMGALRGAGSWLIGIGENIIEGLIHGIENAVGGLLSTISRIAGDVSGAFKSVLGIFSPSRVFAEHGLNIVQGLAQGIEGNAHLATSAVSKLASGVATGASVKIAGAGGASGGTTINFNGIVTDPDATARKIQQMLLTLKRHNGNRSLNLS